MTVVARDLTTAYVLTRMLAQDTATQLVATQHAERAFLSRRRVETALLMQAKRATSVQEITASVQNFAVQPVKAKCVQDFVVTELSTHQVKPVTERT